MTRQNKEMVKISDNGIITEEALLAYANNTLSVEERQEVEKLLKDDPFAQDALEGLVAIENKSAVSNTVSALNKKVRERTGVKERKTISLHWTNYAWAAVLIGLLVGVGFVMINFLSKDNSQIATNTEASKTDEQVLFDQKASEPNLVSAKEEADNIDTNTVVQQSTSNSINLTSEKPPLMESAGKPTKDIAINASSTTTMVTGNAGAARPITTSQTENKNTATNADKSTDDKIMVASANNNSPAEDANQTKQRAKNEEASAPQQTIQTVSRMSSTKADMNEKKSTANIDDAMKSFNSGDYKKASEQFNQILNEQPENSAALYFGGISDYINTNAKKGEKNFDKLLKKGDNYIEGSKWYKANILLKKGKKEEAKKLLDDLSSTNGSYKERAVKKKAELEF